jgi:hypothetical protein
MTNGIEQKEYEQLRHGFLEYFKVAIDVNKHLTTLCAGSLVLIGTFLKDIFLPHELSLPVMQVLIGLSFFFLSSSLIVAALLVGQYRGAFFRVAKFAQKPQLETQPDEEGKSLTEEERIVNHLTGFPNPNRARSRYLAPTLFFLGVLTFSMAVILSLVII